MKNQFFFLLICCTFFLTQSCTAPPPLPPNILCQGECIITNTGACDNLSLQWKFVNEEWVSGNRFEYWDLYVNIDYSQLNKSIPRGLKVEFIEGIYIGASQETYTSTNQYTLKPGGFGFYFEDDDFVSTFYTLQPTNGNFVKAANVKIYPYDWLANPLKQLKVQTSWFWKGGVNAPLLACNSNNDIVCLEKPSITTCTGNTNYNWGPNLTPPPSALLLELDQLLNDPNCNSHLPSHCPPPSPNSPFPISEEVVCPGGTLPPQTSFCIIWEDVVLVPNTSSTIDASDISFIVSNAIFNLDSHRPYCGCQSEDAHIANYKVNWDIEKNQNGDPTRRVLYVTGTFRCCGDCK